MNLAEAVEDESRRDAIADALRSLPLLPDTEETLSRTISMLANIAAQSAGPDTPFRRVGQAKSRAELKKLQTSAAALARSIDELHQPSIDALGLVHWMERKQLKEAVQRAAEAAERADIGALPRNCPRQGRNSPAPVIADLLAAAFHELTGARPTVLTSDGKAWGPFLKLVTAVFDAMGLEDRPEHITRDAVSRYARRGEGSMTISDKEK